MERDAYERPVPPRLYPVFTGRRCLARLARQIKRLQEEVECEVDNPYLRGADIGAICAKLHQAWALLHRGMPSVPCDCSVNDDCPHCKNSRWLTAPEAQEKRHQERVLS